MARIKIEDLPVLEDLSAKEKKGIFGGLATGAVTRTVSFESGDLSRTRSVQIPSEFPVTSEDGRVGDDALYEGTGDEEGYMSSTDGDHT